MKRVLSCAVLFLGLLVFLQSGYMYSISYKIEDVSDKLNEIQTSIDTSAKEIKYVEHPHTRITEFTYDTEEQIQEEIRLGEMELLAQLIHAEAGIEDLKGKRLVADVVLNRIDSPNFPNNLEAVIYQTIEINGKIYWQFDTAGNGMLDKAGWEMTEEDYIAAQLEYEASARLDSKIMYFRTGYYHPYGTRAYKYGRHYFNYE